MKINFIKISKITIPLSIILCILSLIYISKQKINLGLEFTGGIEIELESKDKINITEIKTNLNDFKNIKIKYYGSKKNIQIKIKNTYEQIDIINLIKTKIPKELRITKTEYIGAEINKITIQNSIKAIIIAVIMMILYLIYRFNYKLALSAVITLIHDIILIIGVISLFKIEFDLTILSAVFAVFGYSINDTVVIFDRLRESYYLYKKEKTLKNIINISINNTLSRTMITSFSTLLVTIILIFFSGKYLFGFSLILSLGIIIGTYSSIYISTILLLIWKNF